ncbi:MAG: putative zinc-binding metallopeptidase [Anaerolineales bacterium]|nr:putative zinc-binding metallopeptidase [Anaerolineales bacterium]
MRRSRELLFNDDTLRLELLLTPLNRLDVSIERSYFNEAIRIAREDLKRLRIRQLEPYFYLSTGYGTVAGTTSIALGFYDCNELLRGLNYEIRGFRYSHEDIVNLVRHELGHAFAYAYKLYTRKDFRRIFQVKGNYFHTYPLTDRYLQRVNPWSRDYVNPSGDHYAQKHPDEDFAETFTVLMQPDYDWEYEYRNYPGALKKLRFVKSLVEELGNAPPLIDQKPYEFEPLSEFKITLARFFKLRSTRAYRRRATGYIDPDLLDLFWQPKPILRGNRRRERDFVHADNFIRKHKREVVTQVSRWTGVSDVVVKDLLDKCSARSHALDLWVRKDKRESKLVEFTSFVSYRCALYALNESYLDGS